MSEYHIHLWLGGKDVHLLDQLALDPQIISVQKGKIVPLRPLHPAVPGSSLPTVRLNLVPNLRVRPGDTVTTVGGAIIDDDDFYGRVGLDKNTVDSCAKVLFPIVDRYDDRDQIVAHCTTRLRKEGT
jgi:hypothetical protein